MACISDTPPANRCFEKGGVKANAASSWSAIISTPSDPLPTILLTLSIFIAGCTTTPFNPPDAYDQANLRARAGSREEDAVRISAAVVDPAESLKIFGVDLASNEIQPVWLEIENKSDRRMIFLPTGLDSEYFSPREVSFGLHKEFNRESRSKIDEFIEATGIDLSIEPHATESGFVFTKVDSGSKFVTVDLIGNNWSKSLTMVVPVPGHQIGQLDYDDLFTRTRETDTVAVEAESELRELLEELPGCVSDGDGNPSEPLNLVMIGDIEAVIAGFSRRNFRRRATTPRYLYGRPQDVSTSKQARWVPAQTHTIRIWLTDVRFRGEPVWVGQASTPLGGRFAKIADPQIPPPIDPDVDQVRNDLVQDLIYSQYIAKFGFVDGVERVTSQQPRPTPNGGTYFTDGLRAVLFMDRDPVSLSQLRFLYWERLSDRMRKPLTEGTGAPAR